MPDAWHTTERHAEPVYIVNGVPKKKEFKLNHLKLFFYLIGEVEPNIRADQNHELSPVTVPVSRLVGIWNCNDGKYHGALKRLLSELSKKSITNEQGNSFEIINVFRRIKYDHKESKVTAVFNDDMRPYILDLINKGWTRIPVEVIVKAQSIHTIRHLELMLQKSGFMDQNSQTIIVEIDVEEYKKHMGIRAEQYQGRINNLKQKVINVACQDINRGDMPYTAWYEDIKETNNRINRLRLFLKLEQSKKAQRISTQELVAMKMQEWKRISAEPRSSNANQRNEARHSAFKSV